MLHDNPLSMPIHIHISSLTRCFSDESMPNTPSSPTSSNRSLPLSTNSIPIARTDKHVVLTNTSPARPKVASMQAKLDHTKIDMTMYKPPTQSKDASSSPRVSFPMEDNKGSVHLLIIYDPMAGLLTIRLLEVSGYLTLYLYPLSH